ncbi:GntR family transcriptional regulator [Rhizobium halophytocola]|uniref:DNA-binding GntR family transcriptional regulator n=1 Tax=Rhizobium halophytocola TaxID=735519 RepID=A0ABS4DVC3_9HYPH|nr:GntR family transcriptional regulator [Rhizobium halophytocola]MBP1849589.1 DNA-binding GntR family transcriptional regulator [Rhizobium halophytocola]
MQDWQAQPPDGTQSLQLSPIQRETVQERVYKELRRALICGLFEPEQVLTIRGLADAMMTSTMPVREALGRLISEKALEALPNRSVRVPPVTLARLEDLLRTRILIEGEAIALACATMGPRDLARLSDILAEWDDVRGLKEPSDFDREATLNQKFHFEIYRCSGSSVLLPMIESLWLQSGPCTRYAAYAFSRAIDGRATEDVGFYHRAMVDALKGRDAQAARAALVTDISRPFAFLRDQILTSDEKTASKA